MFILTDGKNYVMENPMKQGVYLQTTSPIQAKEFTLDDFSHENLLPFAREYLKQTINCLNHCREVYNKTKDKDYWWQMIQLLPTSYNQRRNGNLEH